MNQRKILAILPLIASLLSCSDGNANETCDKPPNEAKLPSAIDMVQENRYNHVKRIIGIHLENCTTGSIFYTNTFRNEKIESLDIVKLIKFSNGNWAVYRNDAMKGRPVMAIIPK